MNHPAPALADDALAARLGALAHPTRLAILRHIARNGACCCKAVVQRMDLAQSTVSQHLRVLVDAGLVDYRPERQRSRYTVDATELERLSQALGDCLAQCREDTAVGGTTEERNCRSG